MPQVRSLQASLVCHGQAVQSGKLLREKTYRVMTVTLLRAKIASQHQGTSTAGVILCMDVECFH